MTDVTRPGDGDSELAAPLDDESDAEEGPGTAFADDSQPVLSTARSRPSNVVLLLGAILVIVIAQLVMTWLVLSTNTQVRDQYTAANGLQRCLIHAQLNENQTTDPSGSVYKAAVNICLK
jgi:hypothetical protein